MLHPIPQYLTVSHNAMLYFLLQRRAHTRTSTQRWPILAAPDLAVRVRFVWSIDASARTQTTAKTTFVSLVCGFQEYVWAHTSHKYLLLSLLILSYCENMPLLLLFLISLYCDERKACVCKICIQESSPEVSSYWFIVLADHPWIFFHKQLGCPMGEVLTHLVPHNSFVRLPTVTNRQLQCQRVCKCGHHNLLHKCKDMACTEEAHCLLGSGRIQGEYRVTHMPNTGLLQGDKQATYILDEFSDTQAIYRMNTGVLRSTGWNIGGFG